MSFIERIDTDIKTAMKAGEAETVSVLRMVKSALKNKEIELGHDLADAEAIAVLSREAKQRREAAAEYRNGGRTELAEKEDREAQLITTYLPAQMTESEVQALVDQAVAETGASVPADMGKVMGWLMPKTQGKADGSLVSRLVRDKLAA